MLPGSPPPGLGKIIDGSQSQLDFSTMATNVAKLSFWDYPSPTPLQYVAISLLFFSGALALITTCLRVFIRISIKQFGLDDILICVAMAIQIGHVITSFMCIRLLFVGFHIVDIPTNIDLVTGLEWNYAGQILYNPILALVKISVLVFLYRLGGHRTSVLYTVYFVGIWNILQMIATFIVCVFQCTPISTFWTTSNIGKDPQCINEVLFYVATAALTLLTDIMVLALPFWIFLGLNVSARIKAAVIGLFILGGFVTVLSALRLRYLILAGYAPPVVDASYDISFIYTPLETSFAIVTACGPALKPLINRWFPGQRFKSSEDYNKDVPYYGNIHLFQTTASTNHKRMDSRLRDEPFALGGMGSNKGSSSVLRDGSPSDSEEEIMTYHGIMRKTEITLQYHDKPFALPQMAFIPTSKSREQSPTNSEEEIIHGITKKTEITMEFQDLPQRNGSANQEYLDSSARNFDVGRAV